jgi:hypothetical protein
LVVSKLYQLRVLIFELDADIIPSLLNFRKTMYALAVLAFLPIKDVHVIAPRDVGIVGNVVPVGILAVGFSLKEMRVRIFYVIWLFEPNKV